QLRQGGHVFRAENQTFNLCAGASIDNRRFVAEIVRFHEYVTIRRNITVVTNAPADMNGTSVFRETFGMRFPLAVESSLDFGLQFRWKFHVISPKERCPTVELTRRRESKHLCRTKQ